MLPKTRELRFESWPSNDRADLTGGAIKHIRWMGVVCLVNNIGSITFFMHSPN